MTIIAEERLTVKRGSALKFEALRSEVMAAHKSDLMYSTVNEEKKRLLKAGVDYQGFKDLVSTVGLAPFNKAPRLRISPFAQSSNEDEVIQ